MKTRKHICLDPEMQEMVEKWANEGFRSFSAQITMLVRQEFTRRQASESGKDGRAE